MFDTHCHLNFQAFAKDIDSVVRRFKEKGGEGIIVVGAKIDSSLKAIKISQHYSICHATVGIHPHHIDSFPSFEVIRSELEKLAAQKEVVAIGETGLDYYHYKNSPQLTSKQKEKQHQLFLLHLDIAYKLKKPVIIHCRNARLHLPPPDSALTQSMRAGSAKADGGQAQEDLFSILNNFIKNHRLTGVFHCFSGDEDYLNTVLSLGFYVGFDGNITYKENEHLRKIVKLTPLDRLLVETDSPYLTPVPFRGQRNEPANLVYIISAIAEIKNETTNKIASATTNNARLLFNSC